ncbi:RICIN domain-containing protein, partial [Streptomyces boncukensis]
DGGRAERARAAPEPGRYQLRAADSGLCASQRRGSDSGRLHPAPCERAFPVHRLQRAGGGAWFLKSERPGSGPPGCLGVQRARTEAGAPLEDGRCGDRGAAERFTLEPVTEPERGYRLRPVHTRLCAGFPQGADRTGQLAQVPCERAGAGQVFLLDPVRPE